MTVKVKYSILLILSFATVASVTVVGSFKLNSDKNFQKLCSKKGSSLIIGTSRAARLKGDLISQTIGLEPIEGDSFLNYAFNLSVSPYGSDYTQSILRLCENVSHKGQRVFLLAIDPWALSSYNLIEENVQESFIEFDPNEPFPKIRYTLNFNTKPNIELLFSDGIDKSARLKKMSKTDTTFITKHTKSKIKYYRENHFAKMSLSQERILALANLIVELKQKGQVYLLRIPVSQKMTDLEKSYSPNFMVTLLENSVIQNTPILDFYPYRDDYDCFDGNHLFEDDAKILSFEIGKIIRWYQLSIDKPVQDLVSEYYLELNAN